MRIKIAVFFGGKITRHLVLVRKAARRLGVDLDLVSYNRVTFETKEGRVKIRRGIGERGAADVNDYDILFFRTTGKHWEEVDLIVGSIQGSTRTPVIVDPMVASGKPSYACKAWQMLKLREAGIPVPRTVYGSLWFLHETMKNSNNQIPISKQLPITKFQFPVILKGSGGDRGTRVFKANNLGELERLVGDLRKSEIEEGKRYMLQEYIENKGDYRVLILGKKVLGVMKRTAGEGDFRNNYSMGGTVEVSNLPEPIKQMAVKAAEVCGLWVAGVDVIKRDSRHISSSPVNAGALNGLEKNMSATLTDPEYMILEVNKGPQFKGFMKATGIDVPTEIVKFLVSLRN